jgi:predicted ester cyclase
MKKRTRGFSGERMRGSAPRREPLLAKMQLRSILLLAIAAFAPVVPGSANEPAASTACPVTTQVESTAVARAWHDDVINRRNPSILNDILGPEVVHHAAGGYPKVLNAEGVAAMMGDFLAAFPDLLITFDQFIAKDDFVVERYTASGTHQGPLGDLQATNRTATWTGINIFRIACGRIVEVWSEVDAEGRKRQLTLPVPRPAR